MGGHFSPTLCSGRGTEYPQQIKDKWRKSCGEAREEAAKERAYAKTTGGGHISTTRYISKFKTKTTKYYKPANDCTTFQTIAITPIPSLYVISPSHVYHQWRSL